MECNYKGYTIARNDYPHPVYKYQYYHNDDTDGFVNICKTIDECKDEIDSICDENKSFCECGQQKHEDSKYKL